SDDVVNVRMEDQISGPGVEHADNADATADEPWIESQLLQSLGGSAKQNVVERLLIRTRQGSQFFRQSKGDQEGSNSQQQVLLLFKPFIGLIILAFWAVRVFA